MATPTDMDRLGSAWARFRVFCNQFLPATVTLVRQARGRLPH